jgi:hypothetical protein
MPVKHHVMDCEETSVLAYYIFVYSRFSSPALVIIISKNIHKIAQGEI